MKIEWLEKIIAQIQKNMHCPRCNDIIAKDLIEITGISGSDFVKFSSTCPKCGTIAKISAEVNKTTKKDSVLNYLSSDENLNHPAKIKSLRKSLSILNEGNLKNILKVSS